MLDHAVPGAEPGAPWWRAVGQCAVCRCWARQMLCGDGIAQFAAHVPRCARCGERTDSATPACGACLAVPPPLDARRVACDYTLPWNRLIGGFKVEFHAKLATALAGLMLRALRASQVERPEGMLPVPLAPRRLAERGYKQAWELVRLVARGPICPEHAELLQRPLEVARQAKLTLAQSRVNVRGAFIMAPPQRSWVRGQRLALVDDVMTSGATLREAAASLRRAGASRIEAWVLERTPSPTAAG